jgi:hypothetical protein
MSAATGDQMHVVHGIQSTDGVAGDELRPAWHADADQLSQRISLVLESRIIEWTIIFASS